jgi:hypothetical protein
MEKRKKEKSRRKKLRKKENGEMKKEGKRKKREKQYCNIRLNLYLLLLLWIVHRYLVYGTESTGPHDDETRVFKFRQINSSEPSCTFGGVSRMSHKNSCELVNSTISNTFCSIAK